MNEAFWTAVAAVVATAALALSIVNYFQARERRIGWTAQRSQVSDARNHFRLRNDSRSLRAEVVALSDNLKGGAPGETALFNMPTLPATVEPGNWLPVAAHQYLGQEPVAVTIRWRQAKLGSARFSEETFESTVYL